MIGLGIRMLQFIYQKQVWAARLLMPVLALTVEISSIQFQRMQEIEANKYTLERLSDPNGLTEGALALIEVYDDPSDYDTAHERLFRRSLFIWDQSARQNMLEMTDKH